MKKIKDKIIKMIGKKFFIGLLTMFISLATLLPVHALTIDPTKGGTGIKVNVSLPINYLGMVGWWTFDGKDTSWNINTTVDRSGNGNTGTMTNMSTTTSPVEGKVGQGMLFKNGSNSYINISAASSINDLGPITVSAWIYPKSVGQGGLGHIVAKGLNDTVGWAFFVDGSYSTVSVDTDGTNIKRRGSNSSFPLNQWTHILFTWDGSVDSSNVNIYKNSIEETYALTVSATGNLVSDVSYPIRIGNESNSLNRDFDGYIDDVRIYNRILSGSEILQLYNLGK